MIDLTNHRAEETGQQCRVRASLGDIRCIPLIDHSFDLIVALGVLPWLRSIDEALLEMARVLRPGGLSDRDRR